MRGDGHAVGAARYLVDLVEPAGSNVELIDGTPLDTATAERIACDTSRVVHPVDHGGEPSALGPQHPGKEHRPAEGDHGTVSGLLPIPRLS